MRERALVVGLGNLGLPLARALRKAGIETRGTDVRTVSAITEDNLGIEFDADPRQRPRWGEVAFIVVPTPSREDGTYDPSYVCDAIEKFVPEAAGIAVVSTLLPHELHNEVKKACDHQPLAYCPEFVRLGFVEEDMATPDFVMVGSDDDDFAHHVGRLFKAIHKSDIDVPLICLSLTEAAVAKVALNAYVTTKISFANMIGEICEPLRADPVAVCHAIGQDRRIGNQYFRPGGAFRGPCFPRDARALAALARAVGTTADIAEATERINDRQKQFFPEVEGRGY